MDRLLPTEAAEPAIPDAAGAGALRGLVYTVLALLLLAGAWVRFNPQIAAIAPMLAGPAADVAAQMAASGRVQGLVELDLLPMRATAEAVAAMRLPADEAATLTQAVRRGRLRLVRLPLFDFGADPAAAPDAARIVEVSAAGYTRVIRLTRLPVAVTLPIGPVGSVSIRNLGAGTVGIGALTLDGPVRLPDLPAAAGLEVGVIAQ